MTATKPSTALPSIDDPAVWDAVTAAINGIKSVVFDDPHVDSEFVRVEGLRYLTRIIAGGIPLAIEGWDALFPRLIQFLSPHIQFGLPAADCCYFWAAVHGDETYRVTGTRGSSRLFDVETREGHTAHLAQWKLFDRRSDFETGPDGSIEIVLSATEQPGNWVRLPEGPGTIIVRQYYYDWLTEQPAILDIERDGAKYPPPPLTAEQLRERLELLIAWLREVPPACQHVVNTHHAAPADRLEFAAIDFGWADLQYGKGTYDCRPDEAIVIEFAPPEAQYWGIQLSSQFWEARDWHLRQTSINGHQAVLDDDGVFRAVIAHHDPGVPNWLDAGGIEKGLIAARYYKSDSTPVPTLRKVSLAQIREALPAATPTVTPEQRQASLIARARSVRRRHCD
jgi:hypothetical protein